MNGSYETGDGLSTWQTAKVKGLAFNKKKNIGDIIVIIGNAISAVKRSLAYNKGRGGRPQTTKVA